MTQLKDENPEHPFVKAFQQKEADFERMVNQYAVSAWTWWWSMWGNPTPWCIYVVFFLILFLITKE